MKPKEYTGAARWHKLGYTGKGVVIAIVDSGVARHPDLTLLDGWGYEGIPPDQDASGHGTHVAGIAAGRTYGVAPGAKILPVRITAGSGATGTAMAQGLRWLLDWKKSHSERLVVNISYAGTTIPDVLAAIDGLVAQNVPVCVAAGNDGREISELGYYTSPVVVGNLTGGGGMAQDSNCRGKETDCVTVGTTVLSCDKNGGYCYKSGTSMAAPAVAGMLALILGRYPNFTEPEAVDYLLATGRDELVQCRGGQHFLPHVSFAHAPLPGEAGLTAQRRVIANLQKGRAAVLRDKPGGEKIGNITNGRIVVQLAQNGDSIRVAYPKSKTETGLGWLSKKYLREV